MQYKIKAELVKDEIVVNAKFKKGNKFVHEINHAFPLNTSEKEIKEQVEKAGKLFENEQVQKVEQEKVDKKYMNAQSVINKLNK